MEERNKEKLIELNNIADMIRLSYLKLEKLEMEGKQDTKAYHETIEYLKSQIEMEENTYKRFCSTYEEARSLAAIVCKRLYNDDDIENKNSITLENGSIFNGKLEDSNNKRILDKLMDYMDKDTKGTLKALTNADNMVALLSIINSSLETEIARTSAILKSIKYDITILVLKYLNEYINDDKYKNIREILIRTKYYIIYTKSIMEYSLINNCFELPKDIILTSKMVHEYNTAKGMGEYEDNTDTVITNNTIVIMNDIVALNDSEITDPSNICVIMKICFFKAYMTLISSSTSETLKEAYLQYTSSEGYKKNNKNYKITEETILSIINETEKYKKCISRFTLKR